MENTVSLYRMELRKNRSFFLIILAVQLVLISAQLAVKITQYVNGNSLDPYNVYPFTGYLLRGLFFIFPLMMLYSWYREEKDSTSYQALSSPVRPHTFIGNKLKAFLSIGVIWILVSSVEGIVTKLMRASHNPSISFSFPNLLVFYYRTFNNLFLLLGFVCLVIGIVQMIRQRRLLTGTGIILVGVPLYFWSFGLFRSVQIFFVNGYFRYSTGWRALFVLNMIDSSFALIIGLMCMYVGFFLFDRYSEV